MKRMLSMITLLVMLFGSAAIFAQDATETNPAIGDVTANSPDYFGQTVQLQGLIREFVSTNAFVLTDAGLVSNNVLVINNSGAPLPNSYVIGQEVVVSGRVHPSFIEVLNGAYPRFSSYYDERFGMMAPQEPVLEATLDPMMVTPDPAFTETVDPMMATPDPAFTETVDPMMATPDPSVATQDPALNVTPVGSVDNTVTSDNFGQMSPYQEDLLAWVYNEALPDEYDVYTIIELTDINLLTYPVSG